MSRASAKRAADGTASRARASTTWTAERVQAVCELHSAGTPLSSACALQRASYEGLRDALTREPEWRLDVDAAHATWEAVLAERVRTYDGEQARAARWELERWSREAYAPPKQQVEQKTDLTSKGESVQIVVGSLAELHALAAPAKPDESEDE